MSTNLHSLLGYTLRSSSLLLLGALSFGCGDDDKATTDAGTNPGGGEGGTPAATVTYRGTLVPILAVDTSAPIAVPHLIELLDNDTGKPLSPAVSTMTVAGTGAITLIGPPGPHLMYVHGTGTGGESTVDTILANADVELYDPLVRISNEGLAGIAGGSGDFKDMPDRAALTGAVYWTPNKKRSGTVGCAKIYIDNQTGPDVDQGQRYTAASGLPVPIAAQSQTGTSGVFYFANVKTGMHTFKVSLDDGKTFIGNEHKVFVPFSNAEAKSEYKAVLIQMAFDIDAPANPTLASCPK